MSRLLIAFGPTLLAGLLLVACSSPPPLAPGELPPNAPPVPTLKRCQPAIPPPPVPPAPRTVERLAQYANAEAEARWKTAGRLQECQTQMNRSLTWINRLFDNAPLTIEPKEHIPVPRPE